MTDRGSAWNATISIRVGALDLQVALGGDAATVAVIGPNGAGKTTILRTLAGAPGADAGRFELGRTVLLDTDRGIDRLPEDRRVGYVPQGYGLFPHLSAADNVAFGWRPTQSSTVIGRRAAALAMLARMDCEHLADRMPAVLSGGERQRVALARVLVTEPRMLLLDEPLAALDAIARRQLRVFLADHLRSLQLPTIVATHDVRDVMALDARVFAVEAGRVVQQGPWRELARQPATAFIAEFFELQAPAETPQPGA